MNSGAAPFDQLAFAGKTNDPLLCIISSSQEYVVFAGALMSDSDVLPVIFK